MSRGSRFWNGVLMRLGLRRCRHCRGIPTSTLKCSRGTRTRAWGREHCQCDCHAIPPGGAEKTLRDCIAHGEGDPRLARVHPRRLRRLPNINRRNDP